MEILSAECGLTEIEQVLDFTNLILNKKAIGKFIWNVETMIMPSKLINLILHDITEAVVHSWMFPT